MRSPNAPRPDDDEADQCPNKDYSLRFQGYNVHPETKNAKKVDVENRHWDPETDKPKGGTKKKGTGNGGKKAAEKKDKDSAPEPVDKEKDPTAGRRRSSRNQAPKPTETEKGKLKPKQQPVAPTSTEKDKLSPEEKDAMNKDLDEGIRYLGSDHSKVVKILVPKGYRTTQIVVPEKKRLKPSEKLILPYLITQFDGEWPVYLGKMKSCRNWPELQNMCREMPPMPKLPSALPFDTRLDTDCTDIIASQLYPDDWKDDEYPLGGDQEVVMPFPIRTMPDGACFFNAASRLAYGDQGHSIEMRVRVIREAVVHEKRYLEHG